MKYLSIIALAIIMTSCASPQPKPVFRDMGYGWQELDTPISKELLQAFSYDQLSQFPLEYEYIPSESNFMVGQQQFYCFYNRDSLVISKSPAKDRDINILGVKYTLASLYPDTVAADELYRLSVNDCYQIKSGGKDYILFYLTFLLSNSSVRPSQGILIDMTSPGKLIKFPAIQFSETPLCLNDFDQDGVLDYACHEGKGITCYHLIGDKFVLDEQHYVFLNSYIDRFKIIEKDSSNWFFQL